MAGSIAARARRAPPVAFKAGESGPLCYNFRLKIQLKRPE